MAETLKTISSRSSVRKFRPEPVAREIIDKITEAGTKAASGMNRQSAIIVVVDDPEVRNELSRINASVMNSENDPFYGAPTVAVVLADRNVRTYLYDGSLVMANMMLAAEDLGVGSCWIHRAKEEFETEYGKKLLADLGIKGDYEGIGNLILGWPDGEKPAPKEHKADYVYHI